LTVPKPDQSPDETRLRKIADRGKSPDWLREAVTLLAQETASIPPIEDDRRELPEFIYRH